jgi:hypothetical protein
MSMVSAPRRSQLVRALRSVEDALVQAEPRANITGLERLRVDLREALALAGGPRPDAMRIRRPRAARARLN